MSAPSQPAATEIEDDLTPAQVIAWLRRHPDFLERHPELAEFLSVPSAHGNGVIDMQRFMVSRLQGENARLYDAADALIATGRSNMSATAATHRAVLALLEATSFEHLIHIATQDCQELLDVDVITLSLECDFGLPQRFQTAGLFAIRPGDVDALLGPGRDVNLRPLSRDGEAIFGPATDLVKSDGLARLQIDGRPAVLALGCREPGKFNPGQGTELLGFFARAVGGSVQSWLQRNPD
jgi:uncharacterized protein YigA (DUF484 family)